MDETNRLLPREAVNARPGESGGFRATRIARLASRTLPGTVILPVLLATLFLLTHPYRGIWHDAILYTVQALHDANPEHFRHDLFFAFGSQDDWTLYGKFYQRLIAAIGIRASNLLGLLTAQALWWSGMWRVSKRFVPAPWNWICLLLVASMPADYGDDFFLSYDDLFLSARLPAEALSLWAFSFVLERRNIAAVMTASIALVIHPLIGAAGFAIVLIGMTPRVPWWRIFAATLPVFAITQFLTPPSFAIHPFDAEWLRAVRPEVSFLFPSEWEISSWSKACWVIAVPLILAATETAERRVIWRGLALLGVAGVSVFALAGIAGHDAFWIQAQPWRLLWLLTVMQWVAVTTLLYREWNNRPALIWLLAICWLALELGGGGFGALGIAALAQVERFMKARGKPTEFFGKLTLPYKASLFIATLGAAVLGILFQVLYHRVRTAYWPDNLIVNWPWLETVAHTRLMALLVGTLSAAYLLRDRFPPAVLYLVLLVLSSYALLNIDQRSPTMKVMEANLDAPQRAPFAGDVAPGQMVYWDGPPDEIAYPWLLMKTSSYFSSAQAAGIIFHRETTFEALHRLSTIDQDNHTTLSGRTRANSPRLFTETRLFKPLTRDGIIRVCRAPDLDFVVSRLHYPALSTNDEWTPDGHSKYWLYDCRRINSVAASSLRDG